MTQGYLDTGVSGADWNAGISELLERGQAAFSSIWKDALRGGGLLLVILLLCGLSDALRDGLGGSTSGLDLTAIVGALGVTAVSAADLSSLMGLGKELISQLSAFSNLLMPTVASAVAACGAPSGAAARQMATLLFSNVLTTVIDQLLMPLVYAYVAVSTAYAAVGNEGLQQLADLIRWVVTATLTGLLLAFTGYLTIAGAAAGSADAVAMKATKTAISGLVPVVGGILSDATETVLAGAGVLRSTLGVFGALAILAFCLVPFLTLGLHYLVYKGTAVLAAALFRGRVAGLISRLGGAFGLVLGMAGSCAFLLLISLATAVTMVTP
jgi:stage III sporulation protein AE